MSESMSISILIGCDIGGVVRDMITGDPVDNSIESIKQIIHRGYRIMFISKCKSGYQERVTEWLKRWDLDELPREFCQEYAQKFEIARRHTINIMIDDKIQVLSLLPDHIVKIWFCSEEQKISGTRKYQPELFEKFKVARNWNDVLDVLDALHS